MANKKPVSITGTLAAATCTLLGSHLPEPVQAQEDPTWDFDTAILYYGEDNGRVQEASIAMLARRTYVDDRLLTLGVTLDGMTGASPNGALPQRFAQTFTQASGRNTFTTPANKLPIDVTFRDTRVAFSGNWQQPLGRLYQINVGATASNEFDYLHLGVNAKISRDFNQRNTTVSAGIALASDQMDPIGGVPDGLSQMLNTGDLSNRRRDDSKDVFDVVFGISQVISRNLVVQVNYSYSDSNGYLSDPYKIIGVVDGVTGDAVPVPVAPPPGVDGPSHLNFFEHRPEERVKQSLYTQAKYYADGKVLDISYRYMTDDWEIESHTVDLRYRWPLRSGNYIEPHFRYYTQTAADFYALNLIDGQALPEYASADYRLGNFDGITVGAKYGWKTKGGNDMNVRLEIYQQSGSIPASQLIGNQVDQDVYPDVTAIILQYGYGFGK